ncbi:VanZ like family protein [Noviherbaspirillum humi]|uniref:VanZ like family protein n=1 Tax=Noviherbaspirillum humi TaxID=1688639 RepID=A0A239CC59_9BURK|nr:VanZ family protein [Noviherbaspirillum humi]SNS17805.1 VanZ like family protein [Noviherbaspirillum humi]
MSINMSNASGGVPAQSNVSGYPFARAGLFAYLALVVYASWYPFSGWQNKGLPPWGFLSAPLPYYWSGFDLLANVVGYMPLGALFVFAVHPRLRGIGAVGLGFICCTLLSALMEAGQTYLPSRVSSNLDLLLNAGGGLAGAIGGGLLSPLLMERSRLLRLRSEWFAPHAGAGLIVMALWPMAQIYPRGYLFGHGQMLATLSDWLTQWLERPVDLAAMLLRDAQLSVQQYWMAETLITSLGCTGAALTLLSTLRKPAPKAALVLGLIAAALTVKSLASALVFAPEHAFAWLTPGAQGGLLIGAMMVFGLSAAPAAAQRRLAVMSLLLGVAIANVVPTNPYFTLSLQAWSQGKFLNFNGAAQFLSFAWPFFALAFLFYPAQRLKRN